MFEVTILGTGFGNRSCVALAPTSMQSTRFPAGMTAFMYNDMIKRAARLFFNVKQLTI